MLIKRLPRRLHLFNRLRFEPQIGGPVVAGQLPVAPRLLRHREKFRQRLCLDRLPIPVEKLLGVGVAQRSRQHGILHADDFAFPPGRLIQQYPCVVGRIEPVGMGRQHPLPAENAVDPENYRILRHRHADRFHTFGQLFLMGGQISARFAGEFPPGGPYRLQGDGAFASRKQRQKLREQLFDLIHRDTSLQLPESGGGQFPEWGRLVHAVVKQKSQRRDIIRNRFGETFRYPLRFRRPHPGGVKHQFRTHGVQRLRRAVEPLFKAVFRVLHRYGGGQFPELLHEFVGQRRLSRRQVAADQHGAPGGIPGDRVGVIDGHGSGSADIRAHRADGCNSVLNKGGKLFISPMERHQRERFRKADAEPLRNRASVFELVGGQVGGEVRGIIPGRFQKLRTGSVAGGIRTDLADLRECVGGECGKPVISPVIRHQRQRLQSADPETFRDGSAVFDLIPGEVGRQKRGVISGGFQKFRWKNRVVDIVAQFADFRERIGGERLQLIVGHPERDSGDQFIEPCIQPVGNRAVVRLLVMVEIEGARGDIVAERLGKFDGDGPLRSDIVAQFSDFRDPLFSVLFEVGTLPVKRSRHRQFDETAEQLFGECAVILLIIVVLRDGAACDITAESCGEVTGDIRSSGDIVAQLIHFEQSLIVEAYQLVIRPAVWLDAVREQFAGLFEHDAPFQKRHTVREVGQQQLSTLDRIRRRQRGSVAAELGQKFPGALDGSGGDIRDGPLPDVSEQFAGAPDHGFGDVGGVPFAQVSQKLPQPRQNVGRIDRIEPVGDMQPGFCQLDHERTVDHDLLLPLGDDGGDQFFLLEVVGLLNAALGSQLAQFDDFHRIEPFRQRRRGGFELGDFFAEGGVFFGERLVFAGQTLHFGESILRGGLEAAGTEGFLLEFGLQFGDSFEHGVFGDRRATDQHSFGGAFRHMRRDFHHGGIVRHHHAGGGIFHKAGFVHGTGLLW
nr:MAG TPA: hypothetical protein [Caudoviricetes sp.]